MSEALLYATWDKRERRRIHPLGENKEQAEELTAVANEGVPNRFLTRSFHVMPLVTQEEFLEAKAFLPTVA